MNKCRFYLLMILFHFLPAMAAASLFNYVIIIPSYNNEEWCVKNLDSVRNLDCDHYSVIYVNDASKDKTGILVKKYLNDYPDFARKVTYIENSTNKGALYNLYHAIHGSPDKAIIVTLDGDDWFARTDVLSILNKAYSDERTCLTYGSYRDYPRGKRGWGERLPDHVVKNRTIRKYKWVTSHLRTFYAFVFKEISPADLMYKGSFYSMAWDLAFMFPMLEMVGDRHTYIHEMLYEYNRANPINDYKKDRHLTVRLNNLIRKKKRYKRLSDAFINKKIKR